MMGPAVARQVPRQAAEMKKGKAGCCQGEVESQHTSKCQLPGRKILSPFSGRLAMGVCWSPISPVVHVDVLPQPSK